MIDDFPPPDPSIETLATGVPTPTAAMHPARKAATAFIFITVSLDMLALGMIAPVLPNLIKSFLGNSTERAAQILGIFGTIYALMQFVFAPLLGSLSDRFGRRPVVLLSNFGLGLDYLVMAAAPSLGWLFVGRVVSGITSASVPTAMAYISDVTPPEKRAASFGLMSAAFGLGFVLGPAIGGLLGNSNPRLPFWVAGCCSLLNALYGLLVLPESLGKENRRAFSWKVANPVGSLNLLRRKTALFNLAMVVVLGYLAHQVLPSIFVLSAIYRYNWNNRSVGLALALIGISSALAGAVLVKPIVARFGNERCLLTGLVLGSLGFAVFAWAPTGTAMLVGIPILSLWGLSGPTAQAIMTRFVSPSEQGQLQGAISGLQSVAGLAGPLLFTLSFAHAIDPATGWHLPGLPFYLAAGLLFTSLLLALHTIKREPIPVLPIT